jgi:hypothetical protein
MKATLLGVAFVWLAATGQARAAGDGTIADPKQWCADFSQKVADKDNEGMLDLMVAGAIAPLGKADAAQAFSAMPPLLAREGAFHSTTFLLERDYGSSLVRLWYMVLFENGPVFVRCEAAKIADKWALLGVYFQTSPADINLP